MRTLRFSVFAILAAGLAVLFSAPALAGKKAAKEPAVKITPEAREEAAKVYASLCITCHGPKGDGDGPGSAVLNPKPRKFSDADWQKAAKDALIEKVIVEGGPAIGKSPLMPPNPTLKDKKEVVAALRETVRSFGKK